jgi:hypothetical protein
MAKELLAFSMFPEEIQNYLKRVREPNWFNFCLFYVDLFADQQEALGIEP